MTTVNLSERQLDLLAGVCEVMKAEIDWNEVAKVANFKTAKYARDTWTVVRNKLIAGKKGGAGAGTATGGGDEADGEEGGAAKGKKKATNGKRKNPSNGDDVEAPAAKKATGRKGKKSPVAETTNEDAEEQASEEPAVKPEPEDDMGELS